MESFEIPFGDGWCIQFKGRYAEPSDDGATVVLIPAPEPPRDA